MPALVLLVLGIALAALALLAPLRWAFATLIGVAILIPSALSLPGGPSVLTFPRLVLAAFVVNLVVRRWRGDLPGHGFGLTPVHAALFGFLVAAFVTGVVLAVDGTSLTSATYSWIDLVELFVLFATATAYLRTSPAAPRQALLALAAAVVASSVIGLVEHVTRTGYAHLMLEHTRQAGAVPAEGLAVRGGSVRVRAAADFTLGFSWLSVMLLPAVILAGGVLHRRLRPLLLPAVGVVLLALYWSYSRSVVPALAGVFLGLVLLVRSRRVALLSGGLLAALALGYLLLPSLAHSYSSSIDQGSIDSRTLRIPPITSLVASRPLTGLGLTGLLPHGYPSTDNMYLRYYAEIGVIGLTLFAVALVTALVVCARGLRARDPESRAVAVAALLGALVFIGGSFAFDSFNALADARVFWLLVAVGGVAAERAAGPVRWAALPRLPRLVAVGVAVGGGVLIAVLTPTHAATRYTFATLPPYVELTAEPPAEGTALVNTTCDAIAAMQQGGNQVAVRCLSQFLSTAPGQGEIRVQAAGAEQVREHSVALYARLRQIPGLHAFRMSPKTGTEVGKPAVAATAPVWLGIAALAGALLLPESRRRASAGD